MAGITAPYDIDTIRAGTWTSDLQTPGTANDVHKELQINGGAAIDENAACASFTYALTDGYREFASDDSVNRVLVIGSDIVSRKTDFNDRSTGMLFGDEAGAMLLQRNPDRPDAGLMAWHNYTDSTLVSSLYVGRNETDYIRMDGPEVLRNAVRIGVDVAKVVIQKAYENAGIKADDIDYYVLHQANIRIINLIGKGLKVPQEKMAISIGDHANTSSASIPMAFSEAANTHKIKSGDRVLMLGFGAGKTVSGVVVVV